MRRMSVCLMLVVLVVAANAALAQTKMVREVTEPRSGVVVSLPGDWNLAADANRMIAANSDKKAMVILLQTESRFEDQVFKIRQSLRGDVFRDVEVEKLVVLVEKQRGAYEAAVVFEGKAVVRDDGAPARFAGIMVKSGDKGGLAFGAWKDAKHERQVRAVLESVHVAVPGGKGGLILRNRESGASIQLPEQWGMLAGKGGFLAVSKDRKGLVAIMATPTGFDKTVEKVQARVEEKKLSDVELGEFVDYAVDDGTGLNEVRVAHGKATDKKDNTPVEFAVVVAGLVKKDGGVLALGVWKSEAQHENIRKMLKTLKVQK